MGAQIDIMATSSDVCNMLDYLKRKEVQISVFFIKQKEFYKITNLSEINNNGIVYLTDLEHEKIVLNKNLGMIERQKFCIQMITGFVKSSVDSPIYCRIGRIYLSSDYFDGRIFRRTDDSLRALYKKVKSYFVRFGGKYNENNELSTEKPYYVYILPEAERIIYSYANSCLPDAEQNAYVFKIPENVIKATLNKEL
ncbi:MAG: hypothetical protein IJJ23_12365 [Clostridia bacterium]|nr:hypothetical protein [Clostridia bacterium]